MKPEITIEQLKHLVDTDISPNGIIQKTNFMYEGNTFETKVETEIIRNGKQKKYGIEFWVLTKKPEKCNLIYNANKKSIESYYIKTDLGKYKSDAVLKAFYLERPPLTADEFSKIMGYLSEGESINVYEKGNLELTVQDDDDFVGFTFLIEKKDYFHKYCFHLFFDDIWFYYSYHAIAKKNSFFSFNKKLDFKEIDWDEQSREDAIRLYNDFILETKLKTKWTPKWVEQTKDHEIDYSEDESPIRVDLSYLSTREEEPKNNKSIAEIGDIGISENQLTEMLDLLAPSLTSDEKKKMVLEVFQTIDDWREEMFEMDIDEKEYQDDNSYYLSWFDAVLKELSGKSLLLEFYKQQPEEAESICQGAAKAVGIKEKFTESEESEGNNVIEVQEEFLKWLEPKGFTLIEPRGMGQLYDDDELYPFLIVPQNKVKAINKFFTKLNKDVGFV